MISQAWSQGRSFSSTSTRISSTTVRAGWVSFICTATLSAKFETLASCSKCRRSMSRTAQATRKYSCTRRSSRPGAPASDGYKILETFSDSIFVFERADGRPG